MGKESGKTTGKPKALGVNDLELFDISCVHCKKQQKTLKDGQFHCKYCGVMCENCAAEHQKTPKDKGHWAQKLRHVSQEEAPVVPTFCYVKKCENHPKRTIKGYCLDHGTLCCKDCIKTQHALCSVEQLETMSDGVSTNSHMLDAKHELSDLKRRCIKIGNTKRSEIIKMSIQAAAFEEHVKKIREKINDLIDNMITAVMREKDEFCKAEAKVIEKDIAECSELDKVLNVADNNIEDAFRGRKQNEMWIAVKKLETLITHFDEKITKMENDKCEVKFEFLPNKSLQGLLEAPENIGKMRITTSRLSRNDKNMMDKLKKARTPTETVALETDGEGNFQPWTKITHPNNSTCTPTLPPLSRGSTGPCRTPQTPVGRKNHRGHIMTRTKTGLLVPASTKPKVGYHLIDNKTSKVNSGVFGPVNDVRLTYIGKKVVMTLEDQQRTSITGSTFLPNGRLVLVDNHNKTLKLYSAEFELLTGVILHERPWNVSSCYKTVVAVSYPYDMSVDLIATGIQMKFQRKIRTDRPCRGVGYHHIEKWLYIACGDGSQAQIQAFSLEGQLRKVIIPKEGLFHEPCYLAMSPDSSRLFISDLDNGVIGFSTKTGDVICHYKDQKIRRYWDLKMDLDGRIFVLTTEPNCLYVLMGDHNGQLVKEFRAGEKPLSLSYGAVNRDIVITRWTAEDVDLFRLV